MIEENVIIEIQRERIKKEREFSWEEIEIEEEVNRKIRKSPKEMLNMLREVDESAYEKYKLLNDSVESWSKYKTGYLPGDTIEVSNPRMEGKYIILEAGSKGNFYSNPKRENQIFLERILTEWEEHQTPFEAEIITSDLNNYNFEVSITAKHKHDLESQIRDEYMNEIPLTVKINEYISKQGYNVDIDFFGSVYPGFIPKKLASVNKILKPEEIVGTEMEVMIIGYDEERNSYIASRKAYLQTLIPEEIDKLDYENKYTGIITGFSKQNKRDSIFVQFNDCLTGKIYEADYDENTKKNILSLSEGKEIDFYVKNVTNKKGKILIGLTQVRRDHIWNALEEGQELKGEVKFVKPFGVFITLENDMIGLLHDVEIDKFEKFEVEVGEDIYVRILELNRKDERINLTLAPRSGFKKKPEAIEQEKIEAEEKAKASQSVETEIKDEDPVQQ